MDIKKYEQSGRLIKDINKEFYEEFIESLNEAHDQELQKLNEKAKIYNNPKTSKKSIRKYYKRIGENDHNEFMEKFQNGIERTVRR